MSFPDVSDVFFDWESAVTFRIVKKQVVDFQATAALHEEKTFMGVLQPIPPRKLMVKPEGERAWKWWTLWTEQILETGTIVVDDSGRWFKVMTSSDWRGGGHLEYELMQQPRNFE